MSTSLLGNKILFHLRRYPEMLPNVKTIWRFFFSSSKFSTVINYLFRFPQNILRINHCNKVGLGPGGLKLRS